MATVTLDDTTFWYKVTGQGPPLVFIHGGWSNADAWRPQIDSFAEDYRIITFDVRGHGRTGAGDRQRYSIDLFADDLEQLLNHLDVERPILCGLSLGAMVVQAYLDRYPERAAGAIVAGPARSMPPINLPTGIKPFVSPLPALRVSLSVMGSKATFQSILEAIRATTSSVWLSTDQSIRSQAIEITSDIPPTEFQKIFAALYKFDPPELSHVTTPTLVIYGDEEAVPVKRQGKQIAAAVNNGELTVIPDAGHLVNLDNPEVFNTACTEFLAGIDTRK